VYLVDAAVPGDIDPAVNRIDEAFLYDLGDLERVALEGRASRESGAQGAVGIVDREVDAYLGGRAERAAVPALSGLHGHFEAVREGALADAGGDAEKATRLLVSRLLHGPSRVMREWAAEGEDLEATERLLRHLFGHDGGGGPPGESGET
jgi:glutamyl-tRNA reductase